MLLKVTLKHPESLSFVTFRNLPQLSVTLCNFRGGTQTVCLVSSYFSIRLYQYSTAFFAIRAGMSPPDPPRSKKITKLISGFSDGAKPPNHAWVLSPAPA